VFRNGAYTESTRAPVTGGNARVVDRRCKKPANGLTVWRRRGTREGGGGAVRYREFAKQAAGGSTAEVADVLS